MTGRVQTLRSNVSGTRPTGRQPGELYVNWADGQIGSVNSVGGAQDFVAVRFFSTNAAYIIGDFVVQGGQLYRAVAPSTGGAFVPTNWTQLGGSITINDAAPANPQPGQLWWDSVGGQLYVWYADPNTAQWVVAVNVASLLTPASKTTLGVVKVDGTTINAAPDGTISVATPAMNDNRIINGDMRIDQRNGGVQGTASGYTVDRWQYGASQASKLTWQRILVCAPRRRFPLGVRSRPTEFGPPALPDAPLLAASIKRNTAAHDAAIIRTYSIPVRRGGRNPVHGHRTCISELISSNTEMTAKLMRATQAAVPIVAPPLPPPRPQPARWADFLMAWRSRWRRRSRRELRIISRWRRASKLT